MASSPGLTADNEVDNMMVRRNLVLANDEFLKKLVDKKSTSPNKWYSQDASKQFEDVPVVTRRAVTPFQEWKMERYLWTPDSPEASEFKDQEAIDAMAAASLREAVVSHRENVRENNEKAASSSARNISNLTRPIASSLAKTRPPVNSNSRHQKKPNIELFLNHDVDNSLDVDLEGEGMSVDTLRGPNLEPLIPRQSLTRAIRKRYSQTATQLDNASRVMGKLKRAGEELSKLTSKLDTTYPSLKHSIPKTTAHPPPNPVNLSNELNAFSLAAEASIHV